MNAAATDTNFPHNPTTGKVYSGGNVELLAFAAAAEDYETHQWAGFAQWADKGMMVDKGQKSTRIKMVSKFEDKKTGKPRSSCRVVPVFNLCQTHVMSPEEITEYKAKCAEREVKRAAKKAKK